MRKRKSANPEFHSLEEEKDYWEKQFESGRTVKINFSKNLRQFYNFEIKDLDLERLHQIAKEHKMDLDTFIRQVLKEAIRKYNVKSSMTLNKPAKTAKGNGHSTIKAQVATAKKKDRIQKAAIKPLIDRKSNK